MLLRIIICGVCILFLQTYILLLFLLLLLHLTLRLVATGLV